MEETYYMHDIVSWKKLIILQCFKEKNTRLLNNRKTPLYSLMYISKGIEIQVQNYTLAHSLRHHMISKPSQVAKKVAFLTFDNIII